MREREKGVDVCVNVCEEKRNGEISKRGCRERKIERERERGEGQREGKERNCEKVWER